MKARLTRFIKRVISDYIHSNYVECYECNCLTNRQYAQIVQVSYYAGSGFGNRYYCTAHMKPYSQEQLVYASDMGEKKYYKTVESHTVEVTKTGEPVKKKK